MEKKNRKQGTFLSTQLYKCGPRGRRASGQRVEQEIWVSHARVPF